MNAPLTRIRRALRRMVRPPTTVEAALGDAREAWLDAMAPFAKSPGFVLIGDAAPALTAAELGDCRVVASRDAILERMRPGGVIAEVGVQAGLFSRRILDVCRPAKLHLIDLDLAGHRIASKYAAEIAAGVVALHEGDSAATLATFPDAYFDIIYIDADHSYEGVSRDVRVAVAKVKRDGFLLFNDYTFWSPAECMPYGVIRAVNELCLQGGWEMRYFALGFQMYCDVALARRAPGSAARG